MDDAATGFFGRTFLYKRHRTLNRFASIYREKIARVGHDRYPRPTRGGGPLNRLGVAFGKPGW